MGCSFYISANCIGFGCYIFYNTNLVAGCRKLIINKQKIIMAKETIKILSWNVNGIRAAYKKGILDWFKKKSHILCLQETKAHPEQLKMN